MAKKVGAEEKAQGNVRNAEESWPKAKFCQVFGVSEAQLERHFQKGLPSEKKGRRVHVLMPAGRIWLHSYLEEKGKKAAAPKSIDEAKLRTETAKAEMAELDLADRLRETMKVSEHEKLLADAFSRVSAKLSNFAARAASAGFGAANPEDAERRIEPIVDEVREELRKAEDLPDEDEHDDEDENGDDD